MSFRSNQEPWSERGKQCAFCVLLCFKCIYQCLCSKEKEISLQCWYRGMCAIPSSVVLFTWNSDTYQICYSSSSLPSVTVPFFFFSFFSKVVHFINVYLNGSALLPALLWNCNNTKENTVLLVALHSVFWCNDVFHPEKLERHKESVPLFNIAISRALRKT